MQRIQHYKFLNVDNSDNRRNYRKHKEEKLFQITSNY